MITAADYDDLLHYLSVASFHCSRTAVVVMLRQVQKLCLNKTCRLIYGCAVDWAALIAVLEVLVWLATYSGLEYARLQTASSVLLEFAVRTFAPAQICIFTCAT